MTIKEYVCSVNLMLTESNSIKVEYVKVRAENEIMAIHGACIKLTLNIFDTHGLKSGYVAYGGEVLHTL